jgi:hypothetical protein
LKKKKFGEGFCWVARAQQDSSKKRERAGEKGGDSLAPVRTQDGRDVEVVGRALAALQDGDDVKGVSVLVEEALGPAEVPGDFLRVLLAGEHEELEAGVGGREVLDVHLACVGRAHERVGQQALADDEVRCCGLVGRLDCHRRRIVYADAGREVTVVLESSKLSVS